MISHSKEVVLLGLIRAGNFSERQMARKAGVSRGTVRTYKAAYGRDRKGDDDPAAFEPGEPGTIGRCRCGARVVFPCRACELRRQLGLALD